MKKIVCILSFILFCGSYSFAEENRGYIVKVGDKAPNIKLQFTDGSVKTLKDYRGKVVMLQFTASWCGVCRKEMPDIEQKIWQQWKTNPHFALLGIDLKESKEKVKQFAQETGVTYPLVLDPKGKAFYAYAEKEAGVTRNVIIDKKGRIVFMTRLYDKQEFQKMVETIERLLQE